MSTYFIGDIHGCYKELTIILNKVKFNPSVDTLWLTGDLIARGPYSIKVLLLVRDFGKSVRIVLGNHDLHLLAIYAGIGINKHTDHLTPLLNHPDIDLFINWLRYQPLLQIEDEKKIIMVHAGIHPKWNIRTALQCAREVEIMLKSDHYHCLLNEVYSNDDMRNNWHEKLSDLARLRFSINVLTRMRYCFPNGQLDRNCKSSPEKAPAPLIPWFSLLPESVYNHYNIIFGHWASLCGRNLPIGIYGLDTGCCWGGNLTLLCWENKKYTRVACIK